MCSFTSSFVSSSILCRMLREFDLGRSRSSFQSKVAQLQEAIQRRRASLSQSPSPQATSNRCVSYEEFPSAMASYPPPFRSSVSTPRTRHVTIATPQRAPADVEPIVAMPRSHARSPTAGFFGTHDSAHYGRSPTPRDPIAGNPSFSAEKPSKHTLLWSRLQTETSTTPKRACSR